MNRRGRTQSVRVLILTLDYPPLGGGISRWTAHLAKALRRHATTVLAPEAGGGAAADRNSPVPVVRGDFFRNVPGSWGVLDLWKYSRAADRLVRDIAPDVVIAAQAGIPAWVGDRLRRRRSVPFVLAGHGEELSRAARSPLRRRLLRRAAEGASLVLANSTSTTGIFVSLGCPPDKVRRWAAVDAEEWGAGPRVGPREEGRPVILTVGRVDERKGQEQVLDAWPEIRRAVPDAEYRIVGAGPGSGALARRIEGEPSLAGVRFLGRVDDAELRDLYREASLFLLPSRRVAGLEEGLGLVFLEAALFGLPSVAGRVGGVSDAVLDGRTGILVDPENPAEIAAAAVRLLRDGPLRHGMGRRAWKRVHRRFVLPVAEAKLDRWLRGVLLEQRGARP